jgi:hypothetical protein
VKSVRRLIQSLDDGTRRMLLEGKGITLLEAGVLIQPDTTDGNSRIVSRFITPLGKDPRWLADELGRLRDICADAGSDVSPDSREVIRTTIQRRGKEFSLWALSWPALMLMNNGSLSIDTEHFVYRSVMDSDTLARVELRMRRVKEKMTGMGKSRLPCLRHGVCKVSTGPGPVTINHMGIPAGFPRYFR